FKKASGRLWLERSAATPRSSHPGFGTGRSEGNGIYKSTAESTNVCEDRPPLPARQWEKKWDGRKRAPFGHGSILQTIPSAKLRWIVACWSHADKPAPRCA